VCVRGCDIVGNFNRKGYFGMVAMSAVDSWGRFIYSQLAILVRQMTVLLFNALRIVL
jgi:hypothetical protein